MNEWLTWEVMVGLAAGLLSGWILGWAVDWFIWRKRRKFLNAEARRQRQVVEQLQEEKGQLELKLESSSQRIQELGTENHALHERVTLLQGDFARTRDKLAETARYISKMQNDRENLRRQSVATSVNLANLEAELTATHEEMERLRHVQQATDREIADLHAILAERANAMSVLNSENEALRTQLASWTAQTPSSSPTSSPISAEEQHS